MSISLYSHLLKVILETYVTATGEKDLGREGKRESWVQEGGGGQEEPAEESDVKATGDRLLLAKAVAADT